MDYEEDERSEFHTSEIDWGEELNHSWGEEEDHDNKSWSWETDSEISYGREAGREEAEPEPSHYSQDDASQINWSEEGSEQEEYEGEDHTDLWPLETDSQFSLEEEHQENVPEHGEINYEEEQDQFMEPYTPKTESSSYREDRLWCEETNSQICLDEVETYLGDAGRDYGHKIQGTIEGESEANFDDELDLEEEEEPEHLNEAELWEDTKEYEDFEPHHICFSGHSQGPEAYLRWENDIEAWFEANQIPEEEKTSYAKDTLTRDAFWKWDSIARAQLRYDLPDLSWEQMKQIMHEEFVEAAEESIFRDVKMNTNPEPRKWIQAIRPSPRAKLKKAYCTEQKSVPHHVLKEDRNTKKLAKVKDVQEEPAPLAIPRKKGSTQSLEHHGKPGQCKSSQPSKIEDMICYRCKQKGHLAKTCPSRELGTTSPPKLEKKETMEVATSRHDLFLSNNSNASLLHLSVSKEVEKGTGTIREEHTRDASLERRTTLPSQAYTQGEINGEAKSEIGDFTKDATSLPKENSNKPWRGVIHSLLIKEEPPEAQHRSYPSHKRAMTRGNFLNPLMKHNTNLLSLGAGDIVSRSKPFQEGEYDEAIKSSSAQDHGIMRHGERNMNPRIAKRTSELSSAPTEAKARDINSTNTWRAYYTRPESTTKKNHLKRSSYDEDIEDTTRKVFNEPDGDMRSLIRSVRPNQDEPVNEFNFIGFSTHQENAANWIRFNLSSYEGDNQAQSWVTRFFPDLDIRAVIGDFPANHVDLDCKPNCSEILVQFGSFEDWIHAIPVSYEEDIKFPIRKILDLPYLEPSEFGRLQTYIWRPGINFIHLESSKDASSYTSIHRIRRILKEISQLIILADSLIKTPTALCIKF